MDQRPDQVALRPRHLTGVPVVEPGAAGWPAPTWSAASRCGARGSLPAGSRKPGHPEDNMPDRPRRGDGRPRATGGSLPRLRRMTTARTVPVTTEMDGDELDAEDAWRAGPPDRARRRFVVDSFVRFRYGDGFTNCRALALQAALAVVPFMLALTGLAADIDEERPAAGARPARSRRSPPARGDQRRAGQRGDRPAVQRGRGRDRAGVGLFFALLSMTTAMGQVERGSNRIYGIERDRPTLRKYGRAAILTAVLAVPVGTGFLLLVAGGSFADAMAARLRAGATAPSGRGTSPAGRSGWRCWCSPSP